MRQVFVTGDIEDEEHLARKVRLDRRIPAMDVSVLNEWITEMDMNTQ